MLARGELMTALAAIGPVINNLVDRPRRQQRAALALMPGLAAVTAPRTNPSRAWAAFPADQHSAAETSSS